MSQLRTPELEDAIQFTVRYLRQGGRSSDLQPYGYGLYLPNVIRAYALDIGLVGSQVEQALRPLSPTFYAAAWELCRKGILRPGLRQYSLQATEEGAGGSGYTLTPFGEIWVREAIESEYVPLEPGRFAQMLAERGAQFGPGFTERAQEAVRAHHAHAYLACCAMCGAAAESIILSLAIAKARDEAAILRDYATAGGRGRVERMLIGPQPATVQAEFRRYSDLLKYWRDSASHGQAIHMTEAEAFGALTLLLRFAIYASEHADNLTA